jgi:3-vinyl bacteriochlorophyllide hydratase
LTDLCQGHLTEEANASGSVHIAGGLRRDSGVREMSGFNAFGKLINAMDGCPWGGVAGRHIHGGFPTSQARSQPLYTAEQRRRRDTSAWTMVQGILAPVQFLVFLVSLTLVMRYLLTNDGLQAATMSVVVKTITLYAIMITGSFWENAVFGRYLFAPAFFWEDVVSMLVLALHTAYLAAVYTGSLADHQLMMLALAAYASYVINAGQFVMKLRAARRESAMWPGRPTSNGAMGLS